MEKVYGSYLNVKQARRAIHGLIEQGYERKDIKVVSNKDLGENLSYYEGNVEKDDSGLWETIKDAFVSEEYDKNYWMKDLDENTRAELERYKPNLKAGEIIVLVEEDLSEYSDMFEDEEFDEDIYIEPPIPRDEMSDPLINEENIAEEIIVEESLEEEKREKNTVREDVDEEERVIELKKEKLNVEKEEVETGQVDLKKVTKEETQTIEVPVEKEEIIIQKRSAGDRKAKDGETIDTDSFKDDEEIHIPIKEERVKVSKSTVVDDEVVIKKDKHRETETITEDVKHEDIEVEGDAKVRGDIKTKDK